jgi:penicillin-insensitive murein endopeptidase
MIQAGIQDKRGYFILPQAPEESGYYTYGTPAKGAGQYTHPSLISVIFQVAHRWTSLDGRRFGIGNISLAGGIAFEGHKGHKSGLEVDVRPLRKDGKEAAITRFDSEYDREATARLIKLFLETCRVQKIYFNDATIPRVRQALHHDNHFHVTIEKWA